MPLTIDMISLGTGFAAGVVLAVALIWLRFGPRLTGAETAGLAAKLELAEREREENADRAASHAAKIESLQQENARLVSTVEHERKAAEEKLQLLTQAREELGNTFKALSQDALSQSRDSFLALAQERLKQFQDGAKTDLEKRQESIKKLVDPVTQSLEKMDVKIAELEKSRQGAYGELKQHLTTMKIDQDKLRSETASLVQALRSPSTRGQWGELQLKRTMEMAGMVEGQHYRMQVTVTDEDGAKQRPDVVVYLSEKQHIVVDAKAPIEAYLDALKEGLSEEERLAQLDRHARHVREHIRLLSSKSYWEQFDSPEFVVMFLPGESYMSAALERDPGLLEYGTNNNVILAAPTTLISLMKTVMYGWRQESLADNAREISDLGRELYKRLSVFGEHMDRVGRGLEGAMTNYNKAVGSLERNVLPAARKFEDLHAAPEGKTLSPVATLEQAPRALSAPEFTQNDDDIDGEDGENPLKTAKKS